MFSSDPCELWQNTELTDQARAVLASESAQKSFRVGLQAWAEGAHHKAWDWLERANRQAPHNAHVMFALAMARYAVKDGDAACDILKKTLDKYNFYEGWVFLFNMLQTPSAIAQATQALTHLLCTFGHTDEISGLSNLFCEKNNLAGWCGLSGNGQLHWGGEFLVSSL